MADGTEETIDVNTDLLPPPIVDADTEKHGVVIMEQISSPQDNFFDEAKRTARDEAEKAFWGTINPYTTKPDVEEAKTVARIVYYKDDSKQLKQKWSKFSDALDHFLREFKVEYWNCLYQLSANYEASTKGTQELLVFARTDKIADLSASPAYSRDERTLVRACISLSSDDSFCQEAIDESFFGNLHKRMALYQKFYAEFEPAKEED